MSLTLTELWFIFSLYVFPPCWVFICLVVPRGLYCQSAHHQSPSNLKSVFHVLFIYLFVKTKCFSHVLCFASSPCSQGSLDNISVILVCFPAAPQLSPEALHQEAELEDLLESKVAGGEPAGAAVTVQTNMPRKTPQNSLLSSASNMLTNTPSSYRPL